MKLFFDHIRSGNDCAVSLILVSQPASYVVFTGKLIGERKLQSAMSTSLLEHTKEL